MASQSKTFHKNSSNKKKTPPLIIINNYSFEEIIIWPLIERNRNSLSLWYGFVYTSKLVKHKAGIDASYKLTSNMVEEFQEQISVYKYKQNAIKTILIYIVVIFHKHNGAQVFLKLYKHIRRIISERVELKVQNIASSSSRSKDF